MGAPRRSRLTEYCRVGFRDMLSGRKYYLCALLTALLIGALVLYRQTRPHEIHFPPLTVHAFIPGLPTMLTADSEQTIDFKLGMNASHYVAEPARSSGVVAQAPPAADTPVVLAPA